MAEEENKAGVQPEQQPEQPKSLEQEQREEIEQLFEEVSLGLMVAEAQVDGGFDSYEQFDEFMVTQVGPKHKRLQQIVPQYGMTSKGSDQWKDYLKQLKELTQQNDALITTAREELAIIDLPSTASVTTAAPKDTESNISNEYQRRIEEFKNLINDLNSDFKSGVLLPDGPWRGHSNSLQYLITETTRFEQLVLSPLEASTSVDLREMGYDVRNGVYRESTELQEALYKTIEQTIKLSPGKWKESTKYETEFPQIAELRAILDSSDLTSLSDKEKIVVLERVSDLVVDLQKGFNTSTLTAAEKQVIVNTYLRDVFEYSSIPLKQILDAVNEIQTGKRPNTTEADIIKLRDRFNVFVQIMNSKKYEDAFGNLFGQDIQRLISQSNASGQFEQLEAFYRGEQLNTMGYEQLARLVVSLNVDPFEFHESRKGSQDPYLALVISKVKERLFGPNPDDTPWQNHERERWFVWMSLKFFDDVHQYENQSASGSRYSSIDKSKTLQSDLGLRLLTRDKLERTTFADPEYGPYFEQLIRALKVQAALKPPPESANLQTLPTVQQAKARLSAMNPDELRIHNPVMTQEGQVAFFEGEFYIFSDAVKYGTLASEAVGRNVMSAYFDRVPKPDGLSDELVQMAQDMASRIYTGFTILDESFYELQAATETRGHNTSEDDFGAVHKQTAAAVHRAMRYAKERVDAIAMWGPFKLKQIPDYYFLSTPAKKEFLHFLSMHRKHQNSMFPTELFFEQVEFPGFMQEIFPNTSALFTMQPGERLWISDPAYKGSVTVNESNLTEVLIDHTRKPLVRKNKRGEVYSLDGTTYLGKIKVSSNQTATGAEIEDDSILSGTFEYPDGRVERLPKVKLSINGEDVKISQDIIDTRHYYVALEGMKEVNELIFSKIPGGLDADTILNKSSTGTGTIDTLMSAIGKLKMFPSFAIDKLVYPYLMQYVLQMIQSFKVGRPEERLPLVAEIVRQITRTSHYGGLGRANIKPQIQRVIDNLITENKNEAIQDFAIWKPFHVEMWSDSNDRVRKTVYAKNTVLPHVRWRNDQLVEYLEELWHEEFEGVDPPPLGRSIKATTQRRLWIKQKEWKNETITPKMWHIIKASIYEDKIPTYLNKKAKFEVADEEAKKGH